MMDQRDGNTGRRDLGRLSLPQHTTPYPHPHPSTVSSINKITVHPSYTNNGSAIANDSAVLTLSGDVPFFPFYTPVLLNGDKAETAGHSEAPGVWHCASVYPVQLQLLRNSVCLPTPARAHSHHDVRVGGR